MKHISKTIPVQLTDSDDRSYEILIRPDALSDLSDLISDRASRRHNVVITDHVVGPLYLDKVVHALRQTCQRVDSLVIKDGETSKSVEVAAHIWNELIELKTDRGSTIIALGGGVIGDLAGFIAATFARGIDLIQIPTTLLAQVDSSVGGKVGINLPQAKNIVGAFWQPRVVLIDPNTLKSLDDRNFRAGLAEDVKYGVIMDTKLFEFLENERREILDRSPETLAELIAWCCECKAKVVQADERERTGERAKLNYGHTFGHAIESVYGYGRYLHGEAIAIGMTCAARLAVNVGCLDQTSFDRQTNLLKSFGLETELPDISRDRELISAMERDKKFESGKLYLILPNQIGSVDRVVAPDKSMLLAAFSG